MKRIAQKAGAVQGRDCATRTRSLSRRLSGSAAADNLAAREVPGFVGRFHSSWNQCLSNGGNSFIGYSPRSRRGAIVLCNFIWRPIDSGTITIGMKLIKPDFQPVNFNALYTGG